MLKILSLLFCHEIEPVIVVEANNRISDSHLTSLQLCQMPWQNQGYLHLQAVLLSSHKPLQIILRGLSNTSDL